MHALCTSRLWAFSLPAVAAIAGLYVSLTPAESPRENSPEAFYDRDPQHLSNRLYEALCVRVGPDGHMYGRDRFEPLLWLGTAHLLSGPSQQQAVKVLDEFVEKQGERLLDDPQKRALLQRDLWMVYCWLQGQHLRSGDRGIPDEKLPEARQRLGRPLSAAIGRLALSREQIEKVPDNYAAAVASGRFAKSFALAQPNKPYLPPDLFSADGPWVCVGRPNGPAAPEHLGTSNPFPNSAFLIFLRLPGGREAGLQYLKQGHRELPTGAEVALVRRALLVASSGALAPTPLTESVQLRIYGPNGQFFAEFRLSRKSLLADAAGGLRAVGADERDFKTGFGGSTWDQFEEPLVGQELDVRRVWIKGECRGCHDPSRFPGLRAERPLGKVSVADALATAVNWKESRADWKELQRQLKR